MRVRKYFRGLLFFQEFKIMEENKNKKVILVDMDNVLADYEGEFLQRYRKNFPNHFYIPLEKRNTFYLYDQYPPELKKTVEGILTSVGFFENLPPIEGGKEAIEKMKSLGHEVFICTSFISNYKNCILEKYAWVEKNLGYYWTLRTILTKDKTLVYGDYLIDDRPEHKGIRKPSWEHILYQMPYNKDLKEKRRLTWKNWEDILNLPHL